jgi:myo-inositol-1(or 4)-monophosphatase
VGLKLTPSMTEYSYSEILGRIASAIEAARTVFNRFAPGKIEAEYKAGHDPVTEADMAVNTVLHRQLLREGEGWLSEESVDDLTRLQKSRVWVVDPLDGTREFVAGIPEFCVSIAFVEDGVPVAGGICNPATNELFLGSLDSGLTYNGRAARTTVQAGLNGATILASRSETKRGEWKQFESARFQVRQMGSVAYKLALVAAGRADATFTFVPKHEWDVAAGAALVASAGGFLSLPDGQPLRCNQRSPLISGLLAGGAGVQTELLRIAARHIEKVR